MTTTHTEQPRGFAQLDTALRDVKAAGARLREAQRAAWRRYLDEVDQALAADLQAERPPDDDIFREVVDHARTVLDDLRVQAHLGMMEGDDLLHELRRTFDAVAERFHLPVR